MKVASDIHVDNVGVYPDSLPTVSLAAHVERFQIATQVGS